MASWLGGGQIRELLLSALQYTLLVIKYSTVRSVLYDQFSK